ncbi:hypothetical protein D9615_008066 [Tricholomella constricta]|uniref:Uncharacterized protein n=1 Tax=Tricholomella constricta TaxID=117010 RepID=A0A8H5GVQ8_9AGAR|nr:hypothetical protein D9615_008066 [Tricholomella constricta]
MANEIYQQKSVFYISPTLRSSTGDSQMKHRNRGVYKSRGQSGIFSLGNCRDYIAEVEIIVELRQKSPKGSEPVPGNPRKSSISRSLGRDSPGSNLHEAAFDIGAVIPGIEATLLNGFQYQAYFSFVMPSRLALVFAIASLFAASCALAFPNSGTTLSTAVPRNFHVQLVATFDPLNVPKDCQPICTYLTNMFGKNPPCSEDACVCTNGFVTEFGLCAECVLSNKTSGKDLDIAISDAQGTLDVLISDCNKTGLEVKPYTLSKNDATYLDGQEFALGLVVVVLGIALGFA